MYCYFPNKRFGEEKVAWVTGITSSEGDFLLIDGEYALVLGENITAHELIKGQVTAVHTECIEKLLCTEKTMVCIHEFVGHWFTTYSNTLPLWLGSDSDALRKRRPKKIVSVSRSWNVDFSPEGKFIFSSALPTTLQQCIVFPDIWTMHQQLPQRLFNQPGVVRRHSGLTALQKAVIFWGCKTGTIHTLVTTPAGVFQDWQSLGAIFVVDMHKRWYKSVQDPRYRTPTVLSSFKRVYDCLLLSSGMKL